VEANQTEYKLVVEKEKQCWTELHRNK
jgi:hypothetical protein